MSVGFNIRRLRKSHDLTQEEFGKIADVSAMAVSQWENDRAVPRMGAVQRIADYFGIPKGMIIDDEVILPDNAIIPTVGEYVSVPVYGRVHAGKPQEVETIDRWTDIPASVFNGHRHAYLLEVEGDCMNRVYPEGCLILVDPDKEPSNGSIAAVSIDGNDAVMRRLYKGASTMVLSPESYNDSYEDIVINKNDDHTIELIGTVVWFQSNGEME